MESMFSQPEAVFRVLPSLQLSAAALQRQCSLHRSCAARGPLRVEKSTPLGETRLQVHWIMAKNKLAEKSTFTQRKQLSLRRRIKNTFDDELEAFRVETQKNKVNCGCQSGAQDSYLRTETLRNIDSQILLS